MKQAMEYRHIKTGAGLSTASVVAGTFTGLGIALAYRRLRMAAPWQAFECALVPLLVGFCPKMPGISVPFKVGLIVRNPRIQEDQE